MKTKLRTDIPAEDLFLLKIKYGTVSVHVNDISEADYSHFEKLDHDSVRKDLKSLTEQMAGLIDFASFDGDLWDQVLRRVPEFGKYCDWDKLRGEDWRCLLRYQPQFAEHCDWGKLNDKGIDWLIERQPQLAKYRK